MPLVAGIFLGSCWAFVAGVVECLQLIITPSATTSEVAAIHLYLVGKTALVGLVLTAVALGVSMLKSCLCGGGSHRRVY